MSTLTTMDAAAAPAVEPPVTAMGVDNNQHGEAIVVNVVVEAEANQTPDPPLRKPKRKKHEWTPEEQELYQAKRAQKRHTRKAKKRDEKKARIEAQPEYTIVDGYRMVTPYVYEFRTNAKERWLGRELISMFAEEFGANSPEYYRMAILSGRITVNGKRVSPETIIKSRDLIVHTAHRHEPPVSGEEVKIVHEDDQLLVVSKPPSMPTHACGAYRHNSLHNVVHHMRPDIELLNIVHRLDRLTSGIVILAKTAAKAKELAVCIADREASKMYLARVRGHLPLTFDDAFKQQLVTSAAANCAASEITFPDDETIHISCPLQCQSKRDAVYECHADGKDAQTRVRVVRVDTHTTLLECKPITGRTHQIRLHLQLIGFPIANDPCYGGELHFGETAARRAVIAEAEKNKANRDPAAGTAFDFISPRQEHESEDAFLTRTCPWCNISAEAAYNETQLHCTKIWLHALEYKLGGPVFRVPEPVWAAPSDEY